MFKVNYRIIEELDIIKSMTSYEFDRSYDRIDGCFQMCLNEYKEGFYSETPLCENEVGDEMIDYWFRNLLEAMVYLSYHGNRISFKEIETPDIWIEFIRLDQTINIKILIDDNTDNTVSYTKHDNCKCTYNYIGDFEKTKEEIIETAKDFLSQLRRINSMLLDTKLALRLLAPLKQLENE